VVPTLSASDIAFWENTLPLSDEISLTEYDLPSGTDPIHQDDLFRDLPEDAWWPRVYATDLPTTPMVRIEDLGYSRKVIDPKKQCNQEFVQGVNECKYQLYKGQKLLLEAAYIVHISQVYRFLTKSGSIHAFVVTVEEKNRGRENFLIHNGIVVPWGKEVYGIDFPPILYQDDFLWVRLRPERRIEVQKSNGEILFALTDHSNRMIPRIKFREWDGHWILEVENVVAMDGEELNKKLGFEQIFEWSLIKNKPTYFFQKGPKFGISYGGEILALQYDDIAHGMCCSPAQNNPGIAYNSARFFGKKDGVWRYVVVKFK
jgi:hypothetical protein